MGIWAMPLYPAIWHVGGWFALVFWTVVAARLVVQGHRWLTQLTVATVSVMAVFICFMFGTKFYYDRINPRAEFLAQCMMSSPRDSCLTSYRQLYPAAHNAGG